MLKPIITWVLIANTKRARIIADDGTGLRQITEGAFRAETAGAYSDDEGRTMSQLTSAHTRLDKHVEHTPEAMNFATTLVKWIDAAHSDGQFDQWTVCAAPAMLGLLRRALELQASAPLRDALQAEIAKDLVNVPTDDLASHLTGIASA